MSSRHIGHPRVRPEIFRPAPKRCPPQVVNNAAMQPRDPIAAVTHADPDAYLDLLARTPGLRRDDALGLWGAADAAAVAAVFHAPQARVPPAGHAVPAGIPSTPAGGMFPGLVRMT